MHGLFFFFSHLMSLVQHVYITISLANIVYDENAKGVTFVSNSIIQTRLKALKRCWMTSVQEQICKHRVLQPHGTCHSLTCYQDAKDSASLIQLCAFSV